jgi:hypothetical protein
MNVVNVFSLEALELSAKKAQFRTPMYGKNAKKISL